jgi:hypothetical protein
MITPLPEKITGFDTIGLGYWPHQVRAMEIEELIKSHNQLIDYLKEREEAGVHSHHECFGLMPAEEKPKKRLLAELEYAWNDPGINPRYHLQQRHLLREQWPVLYRAIERLLEMGKE